MNFFPGSPGTLNLWISASWVAGISGTRHYTQSVYFWVEVLLYCPGWHLTTRLKSSCFSLPKGPPVHFALIILKIGSLALQVCSRLICVCVCVCVWYLGLNSGPHTF
jgi:hypothetical protein